MGKFYKFQQFYKFNILMSHSVDCLLEILSFEKLLYRIFLLFNLGQASKLIL